MTCYHDISSKKIWERVSISSQKTLSGLVEASMEKELELES